MFKQVLLAADGSAYSLRACDKAIELIEGNKNAVITVLYVIDGLSSNSELQWNALELDQRRKEKLGLLESKLADARVEYKLQLQAGDPGPTIVEFANRTNPDVCVIGSRGLNTLQEMVLGSVSHKVAKRATCPVLIVK